MYALVTTRRFDRRLSPFREAPPAIRKRLARILRDLEADPFQPHLRLHPLHGELKGLHAVSLTHAFRITLRFDVEERKIILLDIGTHDEVYR